MHTRSNFLRKKKDKLVADITAKVERKLVILLQDHFAESETDLAELSNHVDELENEFRHEVHEVQANVESIGYEATDRNEIESIVYEYMNDNYDLDVIDTSSTDYALDRISSIENAINDFSV